MFKIEAQLSDGTWTDAAEWLGNGLTQDMNRWDTDGEATAVCADLAAVGFNPNRLRVVEIVAPTVKDRLAPDWFRRLQNALGAPIIAPDGTVINWDQCRDRYLISVLQRLELRLGDSGDPRQLTVSSKLRLLEQRLAGVTTAELSDTINKAAAWAFTTAKAQRAAWGAERSAQWGDLKRAVEASTQPLAGDQLPPDDDSIEEGIDGPERELLQAFYAATNSEGGSTDQVYLRGIRAVLARAAGGFIVTVLSDD